MRRSFLDTGDIGRRPYDAVLGYPSADARAVRARVAELRRHGVDRVAFWGPVRLGKLDVLGKGYTGVVILGRRRGVTVAVKIRRTDARRASMSHEAGILRSANRAGVGPRLLASGRNVLVMEYVRGRYITDWLRDCDDVASARAVLAGVVTDCHRLDLAGIDHGELNRITRHVLVGRRACLVDFESGSTSRRPSNVTSAVQGIFITPRVAGHVRRMYRLPPKGRMIGALGRYKQNPTHQSYLDLMGLLGLPVPARGNITH